MTEHYGLTISPSNPVGVSILARSNQATNPAMGLSAYFDMDLDDGYTYRAIGTVVDIKTQNKELENPVILGAASKDRDTSAPRLDMRSIELKIEAVWRKSTELDGAQWEQYGGGLPTSPSTHIPVYLSNVDLSGEILGDKLSACAYVGTYRNSNSPIPMIFPSFAGRRGATHEAIIGRSGSGKTAFAHTKFLVQMKEESHAFVVIDPQGQWSSENGFLFSLQKAAKALGRDVHVLRVSEDIRLPRNAELLGHLLNEMRVWKKMRRMAEDNSRALSEEVAKIVIDYLKNDPNTTDYRSILIESFRRIASSRSIMGRIYAVKSDAGESLRRIMSTAADVPFINNKGEEEEPTEEDVQDAEDTVDSVLQAFKPIVNLFMNYNLNDNVRKPLSGPNGFLKDILKVRSSNEIAPYVILDMSANTRNAAALRYAQATGMDDDSEELSLNTVLDNAEIKAHIVNSVLSQVVRQAETVFNESHGNLDTQIIFDEAWRYAPSEGSVDRHSAIYDLTKKLGGWALDTRKYGIGWTYILQSPRDLNETIRNQLTYVYVGHGIIGADRRLLDDISPDPHKTKLYDQFADPSATGVYPFMSIGPNDPMIFTATPTMFNVFSDIEALLVANQTWIRDICHRQGLPDFSHNPGAIALSGARGNRTVISAVTTENRPRRNGPQVPSGVAVSTERVIEEPPF